MVRVHDRPLLLKVRALSLVGRAQLLQSWGQEFESPRVHQTINLYIIIIESGVLKNYSSESLSKQVTIEDVLNARYPPDAKLALSKYIELHSSSEAIEELIIHLNDPRLKQGSILYPGYSIPLNILTNNTFIRKAILSKAESLSLNKKLGEENLIDSVEDLFVKWHEWVKFSQNQWFFASPAMTLEIFTIPETLPRNYADWLKQNYEVKVGDEVIHRHVMSNSGRQRLINAGFPLETVEYKSADYAKGLLLAYEISMSVFKNKGIFGDGSWIYNPELYLEFEKPLVKFSWLRDDKLAWDRFYIRNAVPGDIQFTFATSESTTRTQLAKDGQFIPAIYGTFYSKEKLKINIPKIIAEYLSEATWTLIVYNQWKLA